MRSDRPHGDPFSGPCPSYGDGSVGDYVEGNERNLVTFGATAAGTCHVTLVFATGFTYSTDVSFMEGSGGCPGCPNVLTPFPGSFAVNNPGNTCVVDTGPSTDAGTDHGTSRLLRS